MLQRAASMPPIVVLSNCHSAESREATPSFVVELVAAGVPVALGWTRPVRDDHATDAAGDIYQQLAAGKPLIEAVEFARAALRQREQHAPQPGRTWVTLALVARAAAGFRVDRHAPLPSVVDARETYQFLADGQMKVLERGFVGRRRPLQRLVRMLRDGKFADCDGAGERAVAGVTVWGMKGMGKSCLVARAVERMRQSTDLGMVVLHGALDDMTVLARFQQLAIDQWRDLEAEKILEHKELSVLQRVRRVLSLWRRRPLTLILDDFEQNLETCSDGPARLRTYAAELLDVLLPACKGGLPKMLLTTTAIFEPLAAHAAALGELRLGELEAASVRKLWMRGPSASAHIPVALEAWEALAARLGNNARILSWARDLLAGKTSEELEDVATRAAEQVPAWAPGDEFSPEKHDELAQLFLFQMAHEAARAAVGADVQAFLQRARVYEVAVPAEAFEGLTEGLSIDLGRDLVALANLGLLEVGELDGQRAYRVSSLVERHFTAERPELWHVVASRFWWGAASDLLERVQRSWRHALAGRHIELAEQAGGAIHDTLDQIGIYGDDRMHAEQHLAIFPGRPFSAQWAGETEARTVGPTARARELLEAAIRGFSEVHHTDKHPTVARNLYSLARVLWAQGLLADARAVIERSLAVAIEVHGTDLHEAVASTLNTLGGILQAQGDLPAALAAIERSLAIQSEMDTKDTLSVAAILHELGNVLHVQGKLSDARTAYERSLAIKAKIHGTDAHPEVAATLHALGGVLHAQGDLPAARTAQERSFAILVDLHGTDKHLSVAASLHGLANVLRTQGDLPAARAVIERSLAIQREVLGTDRNPNFAASLHTLGGVLEEQGELAAARIALERSLAIKTEVHGTDQPPDGAASLHALGGVLQAQGDLAGAHMALERAVAIETRVHGTDRHPNVAASLYALGGVLQAQGDLVGARVTLERALAIEVEIYGTDVRPEVPARLHDLAGIYLAEEKLHDAAAIYRRILAIEERGYGTLDQHHSAETEASLAIVLVKLGQLDEARELRTHAVPLLAGVNPHHPLLRQLEALPPKW